MLRTDITKKIDHLKAQIDSLKPIKPEQEKRVMQKLRLDWNYHSNAIEGNSLNYGETLAFLMHGITAKGKPLKDYLDLRGHNHAIDFLMDFVKDKADLTERDIRAIHEIILVEPYDVNAVTSDGTPTTKRVRLGEYKSSPNHVKTLTGEIHYYAPPEETPIKMKELMDWYRASKDDPDIHPLLLSAAFHHRFVAIHPFDDGNGRMARLLMNLIFFQNEYPPAVIRLDDRNAYYLVLSQADAGDLKPFVEYIGECLLHSFDIYLKAAKGESIEEPEDLDKEILLFKKELDGREDNLETKRSIEIQKKRYEDSLKPLLSELNLTMRKFREFFMEFNISTVEVVKNKWQYTVVDDIEAVQDWIGNTLSTSDEDKDIWMAFRFNDFKMKDNLFDMTVIIIFEFGHYKYQVFLRLFDSEGLSASVTLISKYYDEVLTKEKIGEACHRAGRNVLARIRKYSKLDKQK